jgi:peptide/nickel transport system substrate-binding protein
VRKLYRPLWPVLLTLVAGVGVLFALAYLPSDEEGEALPDRSGSYIEGVAGAPSNVNPLVASSNEADRDLVSLVFSSLVRLGPAGAVQPDLALEVPRVTPDGLSYVFQLRPGLTWHDGEPLDAADVIFTVRTIQQPQFAGDPNLAELFRDVEIEAQNEETVVMTLAQPYAPFLAHLAGVGILPEHLLRGDTSGEIIESTFGQQPVGSGPFRLSSLSPQSAVLRPFGNYHEGTPFLDRLELRFYSDDSALLNALRNGEIEGALFRPGLDGEALSYLEGEAALTRRTLHGTPMTVVYLNAEVPVFESGRVRLALQHALDVEALIAGTLGGQALPLDSPIPRDLWAYVAMPEAYAYDPDLAASLLDEEGWVIGPQGREKDGQLLQFSLAASDDPQQVAVAQELARQWAALGIQVTVQVSGASQFVDGVLLPRRFESALVTVDPGPDPDTYPLWHSSQALGEGRNLSGFSNSQVDELLENGRLTTSPTQRADGYRLFQEIFASELPAVLLYTPTYQYVTPAGLQGLSPGLLFTTSSRFSDVFAWFVEGQ